MPQNQIRRAFARPLSILTQSVAAIAATSVLSSVGFAASLYWDGLATGGWNTPANWSTDPASPTPDPAASPVAADLAFFNISTANGAETISLNAIQAALGLVFNNTGTTALEGGGTNRVLTLGASGLLLNAGAGAVTIGSATSGQNVALTLGGAQTWTNDSTSLLTVTNGVTNGANLLTVGGGGNITVAGVIGTGTGGITKNGTGILTLSGTNTYTGVNTINAGIVRATAAGSLGASTGATAVTLAGGTLQLGNDAATTFGRNTTVTANSTIVSDRATAGAGVTHTLGTLSIGAQLLSITRGALATSGTGTVAFGATTLTGNATLAPAASAQLNLTGIVAGAFSITKDGAGIVALSGANTFTGGVTVAGGTLRASNASALGTNTAVTVLQGPTGGGQGSTLDLTGTITIGAGKTLTLNSNGTGDFRSTLLNSANNNTWAGNIVAAGNGLTQVNAATGTTLTITGPVTSTDFGTLFTRGAGTVVYNGVLTLGPRFFNHTDAGTVIVNSTGNTWASSTVSNGQIQLGATNALPNVDFNFGQTGAGDGRFELNGFNQTVAGMRTIATSTSVSHALRNSNRATASTLTFSTAAATTDTLKNVHIQNYGSLTLVKNGSGRFELQDMRVENAALVVNDGTLAFTGTTTLNVRPNITGLAAATIDKAGTGIATLFGTYNHVGLTTISAGRLNFSAGTAGAITVSDGATIGAGVAGGTLNSGALTFGAASTTTFAPILTAPAGAVLISTSSLTANGTGVTVTPNGANIAAGTYPLISYGGGAISGGGFAAFSMGALGTYPHMTASLVDNSAQTRIDLNVTAVDSLVWTGTNAVWDVNTTENFQLASDNTAAKFYQGDRVLFDDRATTKAITTSGAPIIGHLTFNNSTGNDYTVTGVLTGPGGVTKTGTGTTTLASANTFNGPISVTGGVLVLGGANTGMGAVTVSAGTLRLGHGDAINSAPLVTIAAGATLDVNGFAPTAKTQHIHVSGAGIGGNGAIVNNGAGITNNNHALEITLDGDTTWGGSGRYDVNNTLINGGTFTLTKKGAAELAYQPAAGSTLGNVIVDGGIFTAQTNNPLATTSNVTVNSGATHQLFSAIAVQHSATLNDGATLRSNSSTPTFNGMITLNGTTTGRNIQATSGTTLNVAGKITGTGGFTMNDAGTVTIKNAANDYAGDTQISNGTLNFDTVGKLPVTTNLTLTGGTFDPVNRTHTVASLSGTGGQVNQTTAGTGVLISTQSTTTTFAGNINRVTMFMDGTGTLTLAGTTDNGSGFAIANKGTLVFAKTGDYGVHTVGSGNLGLTINSGGTVQIGGSLTAFTGGSTSNNPPTDLSVSAPPANYVDQIFNLTEVQLNTGGTLDLNGRMEAIDGLAGGGTITNTTATAGRLYVGYNNTTSTSAGFTGNTSTFAGTLTDGTGTVELRKIGTGTLVLSGTSTHTGGTFVTAGTLVVNGGIAGSAVTVNGGTLSGNGNTGAVVLTSGILSPSDVLDPLNTGSLSLGAGSVAIDITGASASDQISVGGTVSFSANVPLNLNFTTYDPVDNVDTFTLILNDGADLVSLGGSAFSFAGTPLPEGSTFAATSGAFTQQFRISYAGGDGNDVVLAAVPEPTGAALVLGGLACLATARRPRRRN